MPAFHSNDFYQIFTASQAPEYQVANRSRIFALSAYVVVSLDYYLGLKPTRLRGRSPTVLLPPETDYPLYIIRKKMRQIAQKRRDIARRDPHRLLKNVACALG
jgi:hypothetical protein